MSKIIYLFTDINNNIDNSVFDRLRGDLKDCKKITFISARPKNYKYSLFAKENKISALNKIGIKFKYTNLLNNRVTCVSMKSKIANSDALILLGGNHLDQYEMIKNNNLFDDIKNFKGIVIAISAGIMNISLKSLNIPLGKEYPDFNIHDGLGLINFSIFPHFNIKTDNDGIVRITDNDYFNLNDLKKISYYYKIYGLTENGCLRIENNKIEILSDSLYEIDKGIITKKDN